MKALVLVVVLAASLASAAPTRRAVCMTGDSLTYGYTFDSTPIALRLATLRGVPVVNMGVGSDVAVNISARWSRYCAPFLYDISIWEGCTNDLAASATGAACWATTEDWAEACEAAGHQCVILGVFPRGTSGGWNGTKETERLAYNALAAAYAVAHPTIIYVDLDDELGDGASPNALRAAVDWGDGLHINGDGMQEVAEAIDEAIGP